MTYREWIRANRDHWLDQNFSLREMIEMSLAAGWTKHEIRKELRYWPRILHTEDPEALSPGIRNRTLGIEGMMIVQFHKERHGPTIDDCWKSYLDYALNGKTWED